jgi:hypothetical protein
VQTAFLDLSKSSTDYAFCEIAILKPDIARDKTMLTALRKYAKGRKEYLGTPIFKLVNKFTIDEKVEAIFEALPSPGVLICGSSFDCVCQILQHHELKTTIQAVGPEWTGLKLSSSYWGFRKLNPELNDMLGDKEAVSYNFSYDKTTHGFTLRLVTKSSTIEDPYLKTILNDGFVERESNVLNGSPGTTVFTALYPSTQPPHWKIPINTALYFAIQGLPECTERLRSKEMN